MLTSMSCQRLYCLVLLPEKAAHKTSSTDYFEVFKVPGKQVMQAGKKAEAYRKGLGTQRHGGTW